MSDLRRIVAMQDQNIGRRRAAEVTAGSLWRDVVFRRVEGEELSDFQLEDRRFREVLVVFDGQIDAILDELDLR